MEAHASGERQISAEGLHLLYQEIGRALHERCEAIAQLQAGQKRNDEIMALVSRLRERYEPDTQLTPADMILDGRASMER